MATIIIDTESRLVITDLGKLDIAVIVLASWRLTRFFSSDSTTKFFREQFYDLKKTARTITLEKPATGPRRTVLDIILSPWSFGLGMTALVTFLYLISTYLFYPILLLALAGVVSLLQLSSEFLEKKTTE
ncbi:MAG: DUF1360 domain-containing protein [Candidatus Paceibacterota bacterium]